jgi:RND superfamily putative drug exporter
MVSSGEGIIDAAHPAAAAGLEVQTGGQLGQKVSKPSTESSELIGIIAAMVTLAFTFGTLAPAPPPQGAAVASISSRM